MVLVSEILLRKTDRYKAKSIYPLFTGKFLNLEELAQADQRYLIEILRPLGLLNQRAVQLKKASQFILEEFGGKVPDKFVDLMKIPGVGRYTANAVLCFSFGRNVAVLDTNVIRLLEKFFGISFKRARPRYDPELWKFTEALALSRNAREYFYGTLDLSNQICKAKDPKCGECPLKKMCTYFRQR
jgi:A/G-specific adenine glycosylase